MKLLSGKKRNTVLGLLSSNAGLSDDGLKEFCCTLKKCEVNELHGSVELHLARIVYIFVPQSSLDAV